VRILDGYLESVIYLYPSRSDAKDGKAAGGSGFLVLVQSKGLPEYGYVYAVTNKHVVEQGARTIRFNTNEGGIDLLETHIDDWERPSADDLAVMMLPLGDNRKHNVVAEDRFVTKELIDGTRIGPGDEVFLVGRFMDHQGLQCNTPSVRFGNISMMPGEPVRRSDQSKQESFLVDLRSLSGYSGSPAFVYISPAELPYRRVKPGAEIYGCGPWLLGVDWGHLPNWLDLVYKSDKGSKHPDGLGVASNAGMAGIVPAWKLTELLHSEDLERQRQKMDEIIKAGPTVSEAQIG
jgi:hypothetical protein